MRALLCDPYLDTLGGGERYMMTIAHILAKKKWEIDVEWDNPSIVEKLETRLGLDLSGVNIVPDGKKGRGYDLCFWLSDGSIPTLWAKKNILHFQVPFQDVGGKSLFNRLKLQKIRTIVCNSKFTKKFIDKEFGVNSGVIYPPVDISGIKPLKKENIILSVGRFSQLLQVKGQDILIDAFKKLVDSGQRAWKLILAGGSDVGGQEYVDMLRGRAVGYPIEILENVSFSEIKESYGKAKIFWSASGFGVDEEKEPEKVEHFGISLVEAMSAGCVPLVVNKGGFHEIIDEPIENLLWISTKALIEKTNSLVNDEKKRRAIAQTVRQKANKFSQERFQDEIFKIIA